MTDTLEEPVEQRPVRAFFNSRAGLILLALYTLVHVTAVLGVTADSVALFSISMAIAVGAGWLIALSDAKRHRLVFHFRLRGMQFALVRIAVSAWAIDAFLDEPVAAWAVALAAIALLAAHISMAHSLGLATRTLREARRTPEGIERTNWVRVAHSRDDINRMYAWSARKASDRWLKRRSAALRTGMF